MGTRQHRLQAVAVAAAAALGLAACSSTSTPRSAERSVSEDGTQAGASPGAIDETTAAPGTSGRRGTGAPSDPESGTSGGSSSTSRGTSAALPAKPLKGKPLKIGLMYSTDTNATLAAIGAKTTTADGRKIQDALLAHINRTGGLAGHPLRAAYHNVSATDTSTQISQKACTQWTEDDRVFVAFPAASIQENNILRHCLGKARIPAVYPNFYTETAESDFKASPLWFEPQSLSLESWARTYVKGLKQQGFFKGTKIGIVYDEAPAFTRVAKSVLLPALKAAGANIVSTATSSIYALNDLGPGNAQMSNAVLRFRTAGVTNVMFFEVWQGWFLFAQNANSQNYHPIYGLSGQNAAQIMIETGLVPLEQLRGSKLVGWNPGVDVGPPKTGVWPRLALCNKIFKDAGIAIAADGTQAHHGALAYCGGLLAFQDGARLAKGALTPESLAKGLEALGTKLQMANLPSARFGASRHYGAATWRPGSYNVACECFKYTAPQTKI
jgi:hypothetical protein